MKRTIMFSKVLLLTLGLSTQATAMTCYLTTVKDSCWKDYDVKIVAIDPQSNKAVVSLLIPKGQLWSRQMFTCQPGESFNYVASFSPVFWRGDENKQFHGTNSFKLPETVKKGETAWNITVCYSGQFSQVPLPPKADGNCQCDTQNIPPVDVPGEVK